MTRLCLILDAAKVYAQLGYVIVAGPVATVLAAGAGLLDRVWRRPEVCIHGWLVNTRPGQKGACPVCERRISAGFHVVGAGLLACGHPDTDPTAWHTETDVGPVCADCCTFCTFCSGEPMT